MVEALDGNTDDEKTVKQTQKNAGWTSDVTFDTKTFTVTPPDGTSDEWTVKLKINSTTKEVEGVEATLG